MKHQCIDVANLLHFEGRPRSGNINAKRLRCKFKYKQAVKECAKEADRNINDSFYDHLCRKDNINLWKSWHKRFCSRNVRPTNLLNGKSGDDVLPEFTRRYTTR